jgi:hypothetical protein
MRSLPEADVTSRLMVNEVDTKLANEVIPPISPDPTAAPKIDAVIQTTLTLAPGYGEFMSKSRTACFDELADVTRVVNQPPRFSRLRPVSTRRMARHNSSGSG